MENGCNDQRSATGSWHQDAIGLLHPRLIANSDRPELQNTRSIMTCLNIQDAVDAEAAQRSKVFVDSFLYKLLVFFDCKRSFSFAPESALSHTIAQQCLSGV